LPSIENYRNGGLSKSEADKIISQVVSLRTEYFDLFESIFNNEAPYFKYIVDYVQDYKGEESNEFNFS